MEDRRTGVSHRGWHLPMGSGDGVFRHSERYSNGLSIA